MFLLKQSDCKQNQNKATGNRANFSTFPGLPLFKTDFAAGPIGNLYGTKYSRMDQVKFFKSYLPQILLGPFLNILSHISVVSSQMGNYYQEKFSFSIAICAVKSIIIKKRNIYHVIL